MKKLLIIILLSVFSVNAQNPDYHRYGVRTPFTKYISYTTAQMDALTPTSTDRTIIHHKDTGINRLEQWDGDSWEELGGDGAVQSVQGYTGDVIISPDDLDDFYTFNKFVTQEEKDLIFTALQTETDPIFTAWDKDYNDLINKPIIPTQISADSVFVSPTIKGYGNAYELFEAHQTSIDSIQANMVTGINTEFQEEDYNIDFNYAFDPENPNKYIDLEGDIEITIYGTVNGDSGYLYLNRSTGSELIEFGNGNAPKNTSYPMRATDVVKLYFIHSYLGIQWYLENPTSTQNVKQTVLGNGTATIDFTKGNIVNFMFSSVNETPTIIDPANNTEVYMIFTQDNTGGKAFNFPSKFAGVLDDTPDEVGQGANEKSFYKFLFTDGIYYPIVMNRDIQYAEPEREPIYGVSFISDTGGNNPTTGPEKAFDGDLATYSSRFNSANAYIGMDYGTDVIINKVKVWSRQDATLCTRTNGALIQYSNNGTSWTTVFTVSGIDSMNYTSAVEGTFSPVSARYWRMLTPGTMTYASAAEIEFYPAL